MKRKFFLLSLFLLLLTPILTTAQESPLGKQIPLSPAWEGILRIVFGVTELDFNGLIILIAAWFFLFLFLVQILKVTPFFKGRIAWLAGLGIMILFGIGGVIRFIAFFLLDISKFIKFLEGFGPGALLFALVVLIAFYILFSKVLKAIRQKAELEEESEIGTKIGAEQGLFEIVRKTFMRR